MILLEERFFWVLFFGRFFVFLNEIILLVFILILCELIGFDIKLFFEEGIILKNEFNKDLEYSLYIWDNWYVIFFNRIIIVFIFMGNKEYVYIYLYFLKNNFVYFVNKNI